MLQCFTVCGSVLRCSEVCCSVLQYVAVCVAVNDSRHGLLEVAG